MNLTEREKALVLVFPALAIAAGYILVFGVKAYWALDGARKQLAEAQEEVVTPQQVWKQQTQLRQLTTEKNEALTAYNLARVEADALCGAAAAGGRHMQGIDALTVLFDRHGLKLTDETPAAGKDVGSMAASLEEATRRLEESLHVEETKGKSKAKARAVTAAARRRSGPKPESTYRRLEFYGPFVDVVRALDEMSGKEDQPIPVAITMEEIGLHGMFQKARNWTLVVRI